MSDDLSFVGKTVMGTVVAITPTEIYVVINGKQSGVVELKELTDDPNATTADLVTLGDELELIIIDDKIEGYIYLSKKKLDTRKTIEKMIAASLSKDQLYGEIPKELIAQIVERTTKILNDQYAPIVCEIERRLIELETEVCYLQKNLD